MVKLLSLSILSLTLSLVSTNGATKVGKSLSVFQADVDNFDGHQYQSYREPVTVKTNSGRIIVGLHAGNRLSWPERSGQDLVVRYSDDQGKTWSPLILAAEHGDFSCQSHGLVYDAQKNRLLFLYVTYNWDYSSIKGRGGKYTAPIYQKLHDEGKPAMNAYLVYSDDEGKTWSDPRDITAMAGGDAHFGASEGRQLTIGKHTGRLVIAGGDERNMDPKGRVINKNVGVWISDDHGEKWRFSEIKTKLGMGMSCEGRVTELPDGTLFYNARLSKASLGRMIARSTDGGESWSDIGIDQTLSSAKSNGCTITIKDKNGKLTNQLWFTVPRGKLDNCTLFISKNGGETWTQSSEVVSNQHVKYSAMIQLDAETVGLFYETNHYKDIELVRLNIEACSTTQVTFSTANLETFSKQKAGSFTTMDSALGKFQTKPDEASIHQFSADNTPGSLHITGGENHSVELYLDPKLRDKPLLALRFNGERWTSQPPFAFQIEAKRGSKWVKIYDGNKLGLKQLKKNIQVDLKSVNYDAFRFTATTNDKGGVLLDNIQIDLDKEMEVKGLTEEQAQVPLLIRGANKSILTFYVHTEGSKKPDSLKEATLSTEGTTSLDDINSYSLYAVKNGSNDLSQATKLGTLDPAEVLTFKAKHTLTSGANTFALTCELKANADLSHRVDASLQSVKLNNAGLIRSASEENSITQRIGQNVVTGGDSIVRTNGSKMVCTRVRIPGMVTSNAGTLLAVYDLRWKQGGDLPGDIDVGLSRSTDGGKTWQDPRPIIDMGTWLGEPENKNGVGDPAILVDRKTGHIYVVGLVAHGLSRGWYWGVSKPGMDPKDTGQVVIVKSEDDGKTWSKPRNLTAEIKDPAWQLMLQGPGAGITTSDDTLVFAFQYKVNIGSKEKPNYSARSSLLYSKDRGKTWKVASGVNYPQETTEAQVVELNDGTLMLNCRISAGGRAVFTTDDLGKTWRKHPTSGRGTFNMTGCMSSILRYSSTKNGANKDILLFSGPADGGKKRRSHMAIRYSLDEGETWSTPYLLDEMGGAYSCLTLIDNGKGKPKDIGIIYEGSQSNMTFERLTLDELIK